jgi:hypothetical protein
MHIHLISTLMPDDESRVAPALMRALTSVLRLLGIAFVLRVSTSDGQVFEQDGREDSVSATVQTRRTTDAPRFDS